MRSKRCETDFSKIIILSHELIWNLISLEIDWMFKAIYCLFIRVRILYDNYNSNDV